MWRTLVLLSANSADERVSSNLHNKFLMEQHVRAKGLNATFLRPVAFMDNFVLPQWGAAPRVSSQLLLSSTKQQLIAVDDIGALAALMFEHGMEPGARILEIAGDELTPLEMAAALSDSLGRRIPYLQLPADVLLRLNENSGKGYARINAGEMTRVGIASIREIHPG